MTNTPAMLIRAARLRSDLTQAELAGRLGVGQSHVARLEAADANPTVATLERALHAAGHSLEITADPRPAPLDETQIVERLRWTPEERLDAHDGGRRNLQAFVRGARLLPDGVRD